MRTYSYPCRNCGKITAWGDLVLDGADLFCKETCSDAEEDRTLKFGKYMEATLDALPEHEGCLYPGATMGEIKAAGGNYRALSNAREYGWANTYGKDNGREAPSYYRTSVGTRALEAHRRNQR